jgi:NRPS condensation-like uncharacterized protein
MSSKKPIPLNSLEKFMLSHESEYVSYNSQLVVEFTGDVRLDDLRKSIDQAIKEIPLLRSKIEETLFRYNRYYFKAADLNSFDVVELRDEVLSQDSIDEFSQKKFNLQLSPAFRFLIGKTEAGKNILIFNVHHTLCDAAGQFYLLEEIFRAMNGLEIREGAKTDQVFRYRDLWKYMGWKWFLKQIVDQVRPISKQRQYMMATLIDHHEKPQRFVTSTTIHLKSDEQEKIRESCKKFDISITEYLTYCCFKALDTSLKSRGDSKTPIMVYLPKTLRPLLKIRYSLQNILTTVWIVGKRDELHDIKFLSKVKHIINSHKMDKASKFIFGSLWVNSVFRPKSLKKVYSEFDQNPKSITSSLLISAGRVPRSYTFPEGWNDISVWARGTMLKSPGVGVIFTGVAGAETLTIEYLKDLTEKTTIEAFKNHLMNELLRDI